MELTMEKRCLLWLSLAEISADRAHALVERYGSAAAVWFLFGGENAPKFQPAAKERLAALHSDAAMDEALSRLGESHVRLLFSTDEAYPALLRSIDDFPYLLYYAGRLECLQAPMIGVVGSRRASEYGLQLARAMGRGLAEAGVTVVSGLARGIDGAAHMGALDADGRTVGVLGCGINVAYPPEHIALLRKIAGGKGLVLSEYPLDAEPERYHFPFRNRIISGLSQAVVFVEGRVQSGGMLTVDAALTQGRQVFAMPGRIGLSGSEGPHSILRDGARICTCARDVLEDLGIAPVTVPKGKGAPLPPAQQALLAKLRKQPQTVEELANGLGLDPGAVMTSLSIMEISGLVAREAGNLFSAPVTAQE